MWYVSYTQFRRLFLRVYHAVFLHLLHEYMAQVLNESLDTFGRLLARRRLPRVYTLWFADTHPLDCNLPVLFSWGTDCGQTEDDRSPYIFIHLSCTTTTILVDSRPSPGVNR